MEGRRRPETRNPKLDSNPKPETARAPAAATQVLPRKGLTGLLVKPVAYECDSRQVPSKAQRAAKESMSTYRFRAEEKHAIWSGHGARCFYCGRPLEYQEATTDHVLPERLASEPAEMRRIRSKYELDQNFPGFSVNDFCNWVPSCLDCNSNKGSKVPDKTTANGYLQRVHQRLPKVLKELKRLLQRWTTGKALASLEMALERGTLSIQQPALILQRARRRALATEPVLMAFGLNFAELLEEDQLGPEVPREYPAACDWLEEKLQKEVYQALPHHFHYPEPSLRTGETLSVRLVFPDLPLAELKESEVNALAGSVWPWEILEIATYAQIYGLSYRDAYEEQ